MATIKAGTYTLNDVVDFSMLLGDSLIEYNHNGVVSIGDFSLDGGVYFSIHINTDGTITHNDVSWMDGATAYTFYKNGGWTDEKYRTWVFASDYEVDDDVADWFNANLYAPYIEITATSSDGVVLHTKDKLIDNDIKVSFPNGGGSGGGNDVLAALIGRTATEISDDNVTQVASFAFYVNQIIQSVNFPNCSQILSSAFSACTALETANFQKCERVDGYAFIKCHALKNISFPECTIINGWGAFQSCYSLETVNFPKCSFIGERGFGYCSGIKNAIFPECLTIGSQAFRSCVALTTISFPKCTTISSAAFFSCSLVTTMSFPNCTKLDSCALQGANGLMSLYLLGSSVCSMLNKDAISFTPMSTTSFTGSYGSIYVPASLLASYKAATNWSYYSSRFVGV